MADNKSMTMKMDAKPQAASASGNRVIYLDLLRIVAAFAVVMLHVAAQNWQDSFFSAEWMVRNVYDSCVRWCVPVFVMISGALFLDAGRELNIKRLYTKNVTHFLRIFFIWSFIYALMHIKGDAKIIYIIPDIVAGYFHMWFLKMLLGLYLAIPILKAITFSKQTEIYFLSMAVITCFLLPLIFTAIGMVNKGLMDMIEGWYNTMGIKIALGYTGYFVLGHFLDTYTLKVRIRNVIYILGLFSVVCVIVLTYCFSIRKGEADGFLYEYLNAFTLCEAMAIFLFFKRISNNISTKCYSFIINFAKMSLGIYLVHILVMKVLGKFGLSSQTFHPSFFIPCFSLIVFMVSYIITRILYSIPYVRNLVM